MGAVLFRSPEQEQIKEMRVALLFGGILAFMLVTEAVGKCTEKRKCGLGRGTCNSNSQCRGRLVCGRNNCKSFNKNAKSTANCCTRRAFKKAGGRCNKRAPCGEGKSHCRNNKGCQKGLVFGKKNCRDFDPKAWKNANCCIKGTTTTTAAPTTTTTTATTTTP